MLYSHNPVYDNFGFVRSQKYNKSISLSDQKTVSKNLHSTRNAKWRRQKAWQWIHCTAPASWPPCPSCHSCSWSTWWPPASPQLWATIKFLPGLQLPPWSCDLVTAEVVTSCQLQLEDLLPQLDCARVEILAWTYEGTAGTLVTLDWEFGNCDVTRSWVLMKCSWCIVYLFLITVSDPK